VDLSENCCVVGESIGMVQLGISRQTTVVTVMNCHIVCYYNCHNSGYYPSSCLLFKIYAFWRLDSVEF
jgi:hypothetical protein